jgi:hypothetical protein
MTTQFLFTLLVSIGGIGGIAYGLWVVRSGRITVRRGTDTETLTGVPARRLGGLIVIGAVVVMLVALIFMRPLF